MSELVTIKIFNLPTDFHMAKSFLESQGIACFAKDELTVQVNPFYTNALNGIKLQVPIEQAEIAVNLLIQGGFAKEEDYEISEGMKRTGKVVDWLKNLFK